LRRRHGPPLESSPPRREDGEMKLFFAYGIFTNRETMISRCPGAILLGPAVLRGFRKVMRGHATIELAENGRVKGVLWLIGPEDEMALDKVESFPVYYGKETVLVEVGYGTKTTVKAMAYRMNPKYYPKDRRTA
jgi:gamma-glutamylcyclotransferase (GGCT)/AIG2-like uncharacterized protein YtfP